MRMLNYLLLFMSVTVNASMTELTILPANGEEFDSPITFAEPLAFTSTGYVHYADSVSSAHIEITANPQDTFKLSVQLETSMSITAEGPHLDLTDWKHCTTDWVSISKISDHSFKLPDFESIDVDCFPDVSEEDIKAEALKQGGEFWISILEENALLEYDPISIGLSSVRVKIEQWVDAEWVVVRVIDLKLPLGC